MRIASAADSIPASGNKADSIMRSVITNASRYEKTLSQYEAEIYIKGRTEILKSNLLIYFAHHLLPVNRKNKDMLFEMVSYSQFNAPNIYKHDIKAINGNSIPNHKKQQEALNFLNINVYSSTLYQDELLTPLCSKAFSYYKFHLLGDEYTDGDKVYKIGFTPKEPSQKLVSGILYITDRDWVIKKIDMKGRHSFTDFHLIMSFNPGDRRSVLPEYADLKLRADLVGNVIETTYHSNFKYKKIEWDETESKNRPKKSLDLTNLYSVSKKEIPIISDSSYWVKYRDIPLTEEESALYNKAPLSPLQNDMTRSAKYLELTDNLTGSINMDIKSTQFRYSGFLNPSQLGYSKMNGVTYRQRVRLDKTYQNDRQLRFRPEVGFIFKRKEIFLKLAGEYEYCPQRLGYLSVSLGNTYQSYPSTFMNEIAEQRKDSIFNFDNLDLPYFRTYFADIRHNIELFHGFQVAAGISFYHRNPSSKKPITEDGTVDEIINKSYNDFTPVVNLTYTPRQYYRMVGRKKEYIYSYYPTFSVEIARAIPNILNSNGDYCRVEANIQQAISLGLSKELSYNISGGMFTDQRSVYFADFRFFGHNYFPDTWSEEMGGKFHLLKREWYNASDKYVQGHFMYESPFILLHLFKRGISKYVLSERFYFGQLWTPVINSYTEVGYGIGNHIFNIAGFVSFKGKEYQRVGVRFAFELF